MLVTQTRTSTSWLVTWAVLGVLPFLAFGGPLIRAATGDTPTAYAVWVVAIGLVWAIDNLRRLAPYSVRRQASGVAGGLLALAVVLALVFLPRLWPLRFAASDLALVLAPAWLLALAWLWFGLEVTASLALPLAFLLLAWPPLLGALAAAADPLLLPLARASLALLARALPAAVVVHGNTVLVAHGPAPAALSLTAACSGSAGLIALLVVAPAVLSRLVGRVGARLLLVVGGAALAVLLNLLRLVLLVLAAAAFTPAFALAWPHAVLGLGLLFALAALFVRIAASRGLVPLEAPPGEDSIALPTPRRTLAVAGASLLAALVVLPAAVAPAGALGRPVPVPALQTLALLPRLPGYGVRVLAIPAQASAPLAVVYRARSGPAVTVRLWLLPTLGALGPAAYAACLACEDQPVAARDVNLAPDLAARLFALAGRGPMRANVEWTEAVTTAGEVAYLHVSAMASAAFTPAASTASAADSLVYRRLGAASAGTLPTAAARIAPGLEAFATRFARAVAAGDRL